jgi:CubicO group peptidase (beta-lactamase class C family)
MRLTAPLLSLALVAITHEAATAASVTVQWGQSGDIPVARDYNDDGYADVAVWRPADGWWYIKNIRYEQWGQLGDVPVPADFNNDKRPDFAVWRRSSGTWFVKDYVTGATRSFQWGLPTDIPMPGDYDGDGRADFAVYRPSTGTWLVNNSVTGAITIRQWGQPGDVPITGDYDGQLGDDFTVFRPSTGEWWTIGPRTNRYRSTYRWGQPGDVPLSAQFACSNKAGQTIWRPSDLGSWWVFGQIVTRLGVAGEVPVPANFMGDYAADQAVWQPSTGNWIITQNDKNPGGCKRTFDEPQRLVNLAKDDVHGVVVAAVKGGAVVWSYGAGMANATHPATPDIPWQLASISKLFIATAALRLKDIGLLDPAAPAGLSNPHNGSVPKLRDFANHTSGVRAGVCTMIGGAEPPSNLAITLQPCFFAWPNLFFSWETRQPSTVEDYSNLGASWVARVVETTTGIDFAAITRDQIFAPLGMSSTGWFGFNFAGRPIAQAYFGVDWPSTTTFGVAPYPAGNLRSTAHDLARFMIMMAGDGAAFGTRILDPGTFAFARTQSFPGQFGFFWRRRYIDSRTVWGHDGKLEGICTQLDIDPATGDGVVVLTNGRCEEARPHIDAIEAATFAALRSP